MLTVKTVRRFIGFFVILENTIFKGYDINVLQYMLLKFDGMYRKYPDASTPTTWESIKMKFSVAKPNMYMLARIFGTIVNGGDEMPDNALSTIHELFVHAFRVSFN